MVHPLLRLAKGAVAFALPVAVVLAPSTASGASPRLKHTVTYSYRTVKVAGEVNTTIYAMNGSAAYTGIGCNSAYTQCKLFVTAPSGEFTFFKPKFKNYDPAAAPNSAGVDGIDNAGDVVGFYLDSKGSSHGFERFATGRQIVINDPAASDANGAGTIPEGISFDGSAIVGNYAASERAPEGFILRGGTFTTYDVPKAAVTVVAFDNYGKFGGFYFSRKGAYFGFYVSRGKLHTVTAPGESKPAAGNGTILSGVSHHRRLAGSVFSTTAPTAGFVDDAGFFTTIKDAKEVGTTPLDGTLVEGTSPKGDLVGYYTYTAGNAERAGRTYGFIATPSK